MPSLYETINKICSHGHHVVVSDGDNYFVVSPLKDFRGNWRESTAYPTLDFSNSIAEEDGVFESDWNEREYDGWKFHSIYTPPFEYYKEGDLVDVLENVREIPRFDSWTDGSRGLVGQKGLKVVNTSVGKYSIRAKNNLTYTLPHQCLAPHIPLEAEETIVGKESTMEIAGKKYKVQILEEVK